MGTFATLNEMKGDDRMPRTRLLIVADDFTGALDTGVQFARRGIDLRVVMDPDGAGGLPTDAQVLVAVAETRSLPPDEAHGAVFRIVEAGRRAGIPHVYKKTDSALRGNIGAELSAALEASGAKMLPFLPALPRMGRTTAGGVHRVDGVPVAESVFGSDPFNPVRESDVPRLIAMQTDVDAWSAPPYNILLRPGICVVDAQTDADLEAAGRRLSCMDALTASAGCAGFAAVLPDLLGLEAGAPPRMPELGDGLMVLCGSVNPITRRQLDYAEARGFARVRIPPEGKLDPDWPASAAGSAWFARLRDAMAANRWLMLDANDADPARGALALAEGMGLAPGDVRQRIARSLGGILREAVPGWRGALMITGGDTLIECMRCLGARELEPLLELFPGVVLSRLRAPDGERLVISKSGGFGEEALLVDLKDRIGRRAWE